MIFPFEITVFYSFLGKIEPPKPQKKS